MNTLIDKVAVVTGSSQGIGAAIATALAVEGAAVVVNYSKNSEGAAAVVAAIAACGGRAVAIAADVIAAGRCAGTGECSTARVWEA